MAALLLGVGAACPSAPDPIAVRRGRPPPQPEPNRVREVSAGPSIDLTRAVTRYVAPGVAGGVPGTLQPLFQRCRQALKVHGVSLRADRRLHGAAKTLLGVRRLDRVGSSGLRFVLLGHGVVEPHGRLLADEVAGVRGVHKALFARIVSAATTGGFNRIGGAVQVLAGLRLRVVVLLLRGYVRLEPVVRSPVAGTSVLMRGGLTPGFTTPTAVVTVPGGATRRARLTSATDGTFHALVPLSAGRGVYQLELLGTGPRGPEVVANFPLFVGVPPPTRYVLRPVHRPSGGVLDDKAVEKALLGLVSRARKRAGRTRLLPSIALARVARAHSNEMCRRGDVRHYSPTTGTAVDRTRRAGIRASWVGENVGRGVTVVEVHREFMRSPAHRAALLGRSLTHLGIGVCINRSTTGGRRIYVTELFIRAAPARSR